MRSPCILVKSTLALVLAEREEVWMVHNIVPDKDICSPQIPTSMLCQWKYAFHVACWHARGGA